MSTKKQLAGEIQRQSKYLSDLAKDFQFPLFNSRKALESQRKSGYRSTAAAAREIVDNAIEAHSTQVSVVFESQRQSRKTVSSVAFVDNGSGMLPTMLRYALSWGGGTHFDDHEFIGKFGFGLPNASINQTRRVEVYSRTAANEPVYMAYLDIDEYTGEGSTQTIKPAVEAELPEFVAKFLERSGQAFDHGTVVVWVRPDHLTFRTPARLKEHLLDDFGVVYRYLLKNFQLTVEGVKVEPVDPLFLDPSARFFRPESEGGAQCIHDETIPLVLIEDPETGEQRVEKVSDTQLLGENGVKAAGAIHLRVSRMPPGLAVGRVTEGITPIDEMALARHNIRKPRRGMTFVRAGREIETVDVFPRSAEAVGSGLGDWPLLQAYAYHWGIEVKFNPALDDIFGIGNDKQTVRPIEGFWRLLADEKIDELLNRENNWQSKERSAEAKAKRARVRQEEAGQPTAAEMAAARADAAMGRSPSVPVQDRETSETNLDAKAEAEAAKLNKSKEEVRDILKTHIQQRPYLVEFVEDPNGPMYTPEWRGKQVVVKVNKSHVFFTTLYDALLAAKGGEMAREAVDVLLITLAKAELTMENEETRQFYLEQRTLHWSPFVQAALRALGRIMPVEEDEDPSPDVAAA